MSKAFTKESDSESMASAEADDDADVSAPKNYITPVGYARLQAEIKHLLDVDRPEMVKVVSWAAALGDRSENADYLYGKKRLREIDKRIRFLTKRIGFAQIVDPSQQPQDKVYFGATVTLCDEHGTEQQISIVGMDEIDPARGRISWISPLAKAILGKAEGDSVMVRTPTGAQTYDIVEVRYASLD